MPRQARKKRKRCERPRRAGREGRARLISRSAASPRIPASIACCRSIAASTAASVSSFSVSMSFFMRSYRTPVLSSSSRSIPSGPARGAIVAARPRATRDARRVARTRTRTAGASGARRRVVVNADMVGARTEADAAFARERVLVNEPGVHVANDWTACTRQTKRARYFSSVVPCEDRARTRVARAS